MLYRSDQHHRPLPPRLVQEGAARHLPPPLRGIFSCFTNLREVYSVALQISWPSHKSEYTSARYIQLLYRSDQHHRPLPPRLVEEGAARHLPPPLRGLTTFRKAHRLVLHSTLGWGVMKKKKKREDKQGNKTDLVVWSAVISSSSSCYSQG